MTKRRRLGVFAMLLVTVAMLLGPARASADQQAILYFFWGDGCPHCAAAKPVLADMQAAHPGLVVRDFEVWGSEANRDKLVEMAERHGFDPTGVPTFFLGDRHWVGFSEATGDQIETAVTQCLATGCPDAALVGLPQSTASPGQPSTGQPNTGQPSTGQPNTWQPNTGQPATAAPTTPTAGTVTIPGIGPVDLGGLSLPVITLLIAAVDGFNPCSLWVLGVLLAITLRTGSRKVTALVGAVFIAVTALVYALFIAGIFTIVSIASLAGWLRIVVALVAVIFAAVAIKDYFFMGVGPSFSIPESAKPGIYRRMRAVAASAESLPALIGGTIVLAAGVSIVELACTAGFPIVWTNILTERGVTAAQFVALLVLYMLIYQLDEAAIFAAAVVTMRATKMQERHGRILKLAGGMLMLTLAVVMIVNPSLLSSVGSTLAVFGAALAATLLVLLVHRVVLPRFGIRVGSEEPDAVAAASAAGASGPGRSTTGRPGAGAPGPTSAHSKKPRRR